MEKKYEASIDSDGRPYVSGPSTRGQLGYYGGTLFPETRFVTTEAARKAAGIANIAYAVGYQTAMADLRKLIGVK